MIKKVVYFGNMPKEQQMLLDGYQKLIGDNQSLMNQLQISESALERAREEIVMLREGAYGSDWQLWQDDISKRIWMTDGKKKEVLLEAAVEKVILYLVKNLKEYAFVFQVLFVDFAGNRRSVSLSSKEFESTGAMVRKLECSGLYLRVKRSNVLKCQILKRHIIQRIIQTIEVPSQSGWKDSIYLYCNQEEGDYFRAMGITVPFVYRVFSNIMDNDTKIKMHLEKLFLNYGKKTALILAVGAGGMLYTPLLENGLSVELLFTLNPDHSGIQDIRKWIQPWANEICTSLSKRKSLVSALKESKDEVIFIFDEKTKYALNLSDFLKKLVADKEIQAENGILKFQSVPVFMTSRSVIWEQQGVALLNLPFAGNARLGVEKAVTSQFWHGFCDYLNRQHGSWLKQMEISEGLDINEPYRHVFCWLVAAYSVLKPYLQLYDVRGILSISEFTDFVRKWLKDVVAQKECEIPELFLNGLRSMKNGGEICFVTPRSYATCPAGEFVLAVDDKYIYISREILTALVSKLMHGCTSKTVYEELVEAGYAKRGDGAHLFPKCSEWFGFRGTRERMAIIERRVLLSDAELLLEVRNV